MTKKAKREYQKKYRATNREKYLAYQKEYQACNQDKIRAYTKEWHAANKDKIKEYNAANRDKRRVQKKEYQRNRRATDFMFKLKCNLRTRLSLALKGKVKAGSAVKDWGCSDEFLRAHLQSKFTEGMTQENYGLWHVDHIIPLSSAETPEEALKLCHYSNLQPLWAADNLAKSDKYFK